MNKQEANYHVRTDLGEATRLVQLAYPTSGTRNWRCKDEDEDEDEYDREGFSKPELAFSEMASWAGQPAVKGSTETMRMVLLTFCLIGIQCVLVLTSW